MGLRPPDYDSRPIYHDGARYGWVGYGTFHEFPSACVSIYLDKEQDGWQPMDTVLDDPAVKSGDKEILLLTKIGITQARFSPGYVWNHFEYGPQHDGPVWVCCDDMWQIEVEDCGEQGMNHGMALGWRPLP